MGYGLCCSFFLCKNTIFYVYNVQKVGFFCILSSFRNPNTKNEISEKAYVVLLGFEDLKIFFKKMWGNVGDCGGKCVILWRFAAKAS